MKHIRHKIKKHHIISAFAVGGLAAAMFSFNSQPIFDNTDNFVLFAQEEIKLEQGVQVSSGDLGSNGKIDIEKDSIINGNLFAKEISIDKNTIINGNASFNKLKLHKEVQILGTQTKPVQLLIANLPEIPAFNIGTQNFNFTGATNTLAAGSYRDIVVEKNSRLDLPGGIYNLRKLELKENSTFVFNASTTINIQFKLRGKDRVSVFPDLNLKPDDLKINYLGIKPKKEKEEREDDDDEINSLHDDKEKKDHKAGKISRPIVFGKQSFFNFKLLASRASVHIGKESTLRGQVLARKIRIGEDSILSREEVFEKESDFTKIVESDGVKFIMNEMVIIFKGSIKVNELFDVASSVNGKATGFLPDLEIGKIEVSTRTIEELDELINEIKNSNNPLIDEVLPNALIL